MKLTASARSKLKSKVFALPGRRFPISDANHAHAALSGASRALHAGNISSDQAATVRAKAHRFLQRLGSGAAPRLGTEA